MKLLLLLAVFYLVATTGSYANQAAFVPKSPTNVNLIRKQLLEILKQEAEIKAKRQKLLAQLGIGENKQPNLVTTTPITTAKPQILNIAFGSADVKPKEKPIPEVKSSSAGLGIGTVRNKFPKYRTF